MADWLVAPSEFVVRSLIEVGLPREKIILVPFGVDVDRFRPRQAAVSSRPFTVLYVGQIALRKGLQYLLEAWRGLDSTGARLRLIGPIAEEAGRWLLDKYAGLYEWIPNIPNHELHHYYQDSDLFVLPSLAEGSALVSYEALASGLPCIVTENSGSVIRDGVDGLVVPPRDVYGLQRAIIEFRDNVELRLTLGRAARRRAEDFSWTRYRARMRDVYLQIWAASRMNRRYMGW
jgi:glycosyltransferase involved in cell wall biosynthesis